MTNYGTAYLVFNGAVGVVHNNISFDNQANVVASTTSTAYYNGTVANVINGTSAITYGNLTLNNSGHITLNTPVSVASVGTFTSGNFITTATNYMQYNAGSSVSGVSNASHVFGPVQKVGNTAFTFPIGNAAYYRPAGIANLTGSETFTAQYIKANPKTAVGSALAGTINHISACEYWVITHAAAVGAKIVLSWDAPTPSCGVTTLGDLVVAHWTGAQWDNEGSNGAPTGSTAQGTITSNNVVASFSPFTLGSTTTNNALPIQLLNFFATCTNDKVSIKWVTETELNNASFTLQKSMDGQSYFDFSTLPGAGTSNIENKYSIEDYNPYSQITYYRLKQTDYNSVETFSPSISVECKGSSDEIKPMIVSLTQRDNTISVLYTSDKEAPCTLMVQSLSGQLLSNVELKAERGLNGFDVDISNFACGIYLLSIYQQNTVLTKKTVICR